jgi:hypothetical protein
MGRAAGLWTPARRVVPAEEKGRQREAARAGKAARKLEESTPARKAPCEPVAAMPPRQRLAEAGILRAKY